ncbi:MAG: glycoside hydrolase family 1 protein [Myxococcota bacterium]
MKRLIPVFAALGLVGCGDADAPDSGGRDVAGDDTEASPTLAADLPDGFHLGAATAAHQVEGGQTNNWTWWETLPAFSDFVDESSGQAADHWNRYEEDLDLLAGMGLDTYRMSIEWSRVEPERDQEDAEAVAHYGDVFAAMEARGIRPSVTLHHFTEPQWLADLTVVEEPFNETFCPDGPTEGDLCSWLSPGTVDEFAEYCGRMAEVYGDRVDEWWTLNEAPGVWTGGFVTGDFPPGLSAWSWEEVEAHSLPALRNLMAGHAACYRAVHDEDTVDADGDGVAARVGLTVGTGNARPADPENPDDVAAAEQATYVASHLVLDAVAEGRLDADFDADPEEQHPEWAGTLDLIGLQYYASTTVVGVSVHPLLLGTPCVAIEGFTRLLKDRGCPGPPTDEFPFDDAGDGEIYGRQHDPDGLAEVLGGLHARYPDTPIVVTEHGYANDDAMRANSILRHLRAASEAVEAGVPLEGYYHWSLLDNFEWGRGFDVRFGLVEVDFEGDLSRTLTVAADVYRAVAEAGGIPEDLWETWSDPDDLPTR